MKVALVDPSLFTLPYDRELADGLQDAGHRVSLYGKAPAGAEAQSAPDILRPMFYGGLAGGFWATLPKPLFRIAKGFSHIAGMRRFCAEMERLRPDVIHFQWLPVPMVDSWFLRRLRRIAPLVVTVHDTTPFNGAPGSSLQAIGAFAALRRFDALIVHTEQGRQIVAGHVDHAERVRCIPHGLLHEGDVVAEEQPRMRAPEAPITFLLFGKIKPYKGLDVLIRALAGLDPARRARCRLRVVGKAYMDMRPLEELAARAGVADRIDFDLRFVSATELDGIFRAADVLVFPYRQIEASGVLMTALAVGKPVIATRLGAAAELFGDGRGGVLIPIDDPQALAAAMTEFIDRPELIASRAAHVRHLRESIPSWPEIGRLTTAAYEAAHGHWRNSSAAGAAGELVPQAERGISGPN